MPARRPRGNSFVLAVLRSPAHRLLSGMAVELRYTGRRSGRRYVLPVQYAAGPVTGPAAKTPLAVGFGLQKKRLRSRSVHNPLQPRKVGYNLRRLRAPWVPRSLVFFRS